MIQNVYIKNYGGSAPAPPIPIGYSRPPFNTMQVGDTAIGQDFFVLPLDSNSNQILNHFGSKWRFTGITGGYYDRDTSEYKDVNGNVTSRALAYPNDLRCDWATLNPNGEFYLWYFDNTFSAGTMTLSDAVDYCDLLTVGSFSGFNVPSFNDLMSLFQVYSSILMSISELLSATASVGWWTNTDFPYSSGLNVYVVNNNYNIIGQNKNTVNTYSRPLPVRLTNITEL